MIFDSQRIFHQRYRVLPFEPLGERETGLPAWDLALDERVVIQTYVNLTQADWDQFHAAAQALLAGGHPNLPALRDAFEIDSQTGALVWPLIEGESLEKRLHGSGPAPVLRMVAWTRQVAEAVAFLHAAPRNFAGLEIGPHAVRLLLDGRALLVDFNLGTPAVSPRDETRPGRTAQLDPDDLATLPGRTARPDRAVTLPSAGGSEPASSILQDIYDLGRLLFTGLAGEAPPALAERTAGARLPDLRSLNPNVSPALEAAVLRTIHIAPEERFQSAREFIDAIDRVMEQRVAIHLAPDAGSQVLPVEQLVIEPPTPARPRPFGGRVDDPPRRRAAILAPAILLLILLALAGLALARGRDDLSGLGGWSSPAAQENALAVDLPKATPSPTPARSIGRGSPTPLAAARQATALPTSAPPTPTRPVLTPPPPALLDWRENSFMPMFTGCPNPDALCVRSDTNRSTAAGSQNFAAVMVLRNPLRIDAAWDSPHLVFMVRIRTLNLASIPTFARAGSPPAALRVLAPDGVLLEEVKLVSTADRWQAAAVDLSAYRGQEIALEFVIGKYWGMMYLNEVQLAPDYRPEWDVSEEIE